MLQKTALVQRWFPEKTQETTRPKTVRGTVKADKLDGGVFAVKWTFKYGRISYRVVGNGESGLLALDAACRNAEAQYSAAVAAAGDA